MSAGKRQWLVQDQDENLLRALEVQDEKAGKLYQETLTAGIYKLVDPIASASQPMSQIATKQGRFHMTNNH